MWDLRGEVTTDPEAQVQELREQIRSMQVRIACHEKVTLRYENETEFAKELLVRAAQRLVPEALAGVLQGCDPARIQGTKTLDTWIHWLAQALEEADRWSAAAELARARAEIERLRQEVESWRQEQQKSQSALIECTRRLGAAEQRERALWDDLTRMEPWRGGQESTSAAAGNEEGTPSWSALTKASCPELDLEFPDENREFRSNLAAIVQLLAMGEECRQASLARQARVYSAGLTTRLFRCLGERGYVDTVRARLGPGRPTLLYQLRERGRALARSLGVTPGGGVAELLARHRSAEQALLVLRARDLLESWYHTVHLWPPVFHTPRGRQCRPDLLAVPYKGAAGQSAEGMETLCVEVEVHPVCTGDYTRKPARIRKWEVFHEVNGGRLYIVTLGRTAQEKMLLEMALWQEATGQKLVLYITNVLAPEAGWEEWDLG